MHPSQLIIGALSGLQYPNRRDLVRRTWGKDCRASGLPYYFLLPQDGALAESDVGQDDVWVLPARNHYRFLPERTRAFFHKALTEYPDWKWLLKTDDDSYLSIPRLLKFELPADCDYYGAEWRPGVSYASGAGYFVSRRAAQTIVDVMRVTAGPEDQYVGYILQAHGIPFVKDPTWRYIIPFASRSLRASAENEVFITHKLLINNDPQQLDVDTWTACHHSTGIPSPAPDCYH